MTLWPNTLDFVFIGCSNKPRHCAKALMFFFCDLENEVAKQCHSSSSNWTGSSTSMTDGINTFIEIIIRSVSALFSCTCSGVAICLFLTLFNEPTAHFSLKETSRKPSVFI